MSATTRLLTTVSVASVVCRNVHVAILSQEVKILHMSEVPLKHLLLKNIRKSASVPEALFSTYLNLLESMSSSSTHQEFNKTIMEPFLESCYVLNDTSPIHEVPVNIGNDIELSDAEDTSTSANMDVNIIKECGGSLDIKCPMSKQNYKALRKWKRFGRENLAVNSNDTFVLRLLSFNILAQNLLETYSYLYKANDKRALSWESRKSLLLQEILQAEANVICLQEVQSEHLGEIVKPFRDLGYAYLYKKRTNDKEDGLLLLYRSDQFNLVDHAKVELYQSGIELLSRDNVGLIAKLSLKDSPDTQIVIATTHLLYNPRRNDVRLGQTQLLFTELERIAFIENTPTGARYHPIILAGDFNLEPYTGVYRFITEGTFEYVGKGRNLEPAEYRLFCRLSNVLIPPRLYVTDNCQHYNVLKKRLRGEGDGRVMLENSETKELPDETNSSNDPASIYQKSELDLNTGKCQKIELIEGHYASFSSGRLTHPFKFKSVYQHTDRYGNREATTNQGKWITVDYIFFHEIQPFEKYTLPTVEQCKLFPTIPNFTLANRLLFSGIKHAYIALTKRGADMQDICENIRTAIEHGRTDIIRTLLDACENGNAGEGITREKILNEPMLEDGTFLCYASKTNQVDVVRTLLNCGADPAIQNLQGFNAVDVASSDVIRRIYVEELLTATAASEVSRVIQLLAAGININSWDSEGSKNTPLHWAACYGNKDIVTCLIERGADVNSENGCGATPLHDAVNRGDVSICQELLQYGANPLVRAVKGKFAGKTPYELARSKPALYGLLQRFLPSSLSQEGDAMHSPNASFTEPNFPNPKTITSNISQLSIDSTKSSDQMYDVPVREPSGESPIRSIADKESIYSLIWPEPKTVLELGPLSPPFIAGKELFISIIQGSESIHKILDVWEISRTHLLELGHDVKIGEVQPGSGRSPGDNRIECIVNRKLFNVADGYQLHVSQNSIKVSAGSLSGLHYAVCTFVQILRLSKNQNKSEVCEIEAVLIKDEPRFKHRGILLDISPRGRIPTLDYLLHTIDLWSSFKVSHLHLYSRLTPSCDWQLCYSRSEMVTLDRYCRDRHLDLVPALDVDSNVSQRHLTQMWPVFQELLATFPSLSYVHVGPRLASLLVQPESLDSSLSINETVETDMSEVFRSYTCLQELWHILSLNSDTTLLLCSNGLHSKPEFRSVPSNVVLVEYGFQADYDFSEWTEAFRIAGGNVLPSSGTASYNSLGGCPASTYANTKNAIKTALEQDSIGIVVAHWSGSHHLTPHPFAWVGYLIGAGLAWNPNTEIDLGCFENYETNQSPGTPRQHQRSITQLLDTHVFQDSEGKVGSAIMELGRVDTLVLTLSKNQGANDLKQIPDNRGSTLYRLLTDPDNVNLEYLSADLFMKMTKQIKRVSHFLYEGNLTSKFASMEIQELQLTADLMLTACRIGRTLIGVGVNPNSNMGLAVINLGVCNLPPTFRTDIANKMLAHIEQYKGAWLQRHLPQGLQSSLLVLTSALHRFVPEP